MRYTDRRHVSHDLACHGMIVRSFPVAFLRFLVGVSQSKPFIHIAPADNSATFDEKGEVDLGSYPEPHPPADPPS